MTTDDASRDFAIPACSQSCSCALHLHAVAVRTKDDSTTALSQVTLIYHTKLDDDLRTAAEKLRTALSEAPSSSEAAVTVIGRSHKQVLLLS